MKKVICLLQICLIVWTPYAVNADLIDDYADEGQAEGRLMIPLPGDLIHMDSGTGDFTFYPGSGSELEIDPDQVFSGQTGYDPQQIIDAGDDNTDIVNLTDMQADDLAHETSSVGQAWRTVLASQHNSHPDLREDPIWGATDAILEETFTGMFQDCEKTQNVIPVTNEYHVPDIKSCERVIKPGACEGERRVYGISETMVKKCMPGTVVATAQGSIGSSISGAVVLNTTDYRFVCGNDGSSYVIDGYGTIPDAVGNSFSTTLNGVTFTQSCVPSGNSFSCQLSTSDGGTASTSFQILDVENFLPQEFNISVYNREWRNDNLDTYVMETLPRAIEAGGGLYRTESGTTTHSQEFCPSSGDTGEECRTVTGELPYWKVTFLSGAGNPVRVSTPRDTIYIDVTLDPGDSFTFAHMYIDQSGDPTAPIYAWKNSTILRHGGPTAANRKKGYFHAITTTAPPASVVRYEADDEVVYTPSGCNLTTFCEMEEWTCNEADNTRVFDGLTLTPTVAQSVGLTPIYDGDDHNPVCWNASAPMNCDFNVGTMECWTDVNGEMQCPENLGDRESTCEQYEQDPTCAWMSSSCIDGLEDPGGFCFGWEDIYDCGHTVESQTALIEEFYECDGDTRCIENGGSGEEGATQQDISSTLSDIETCQQSYVEPGTALQVTHEYDAELIRFHGGNGGLSSCGLGCLDIWVGKDEDATWRGSCRIFEQATRLEILNEDVFTNVRVNFAAWDDYMQIYLNSLKIWESSTNFPPETAGACELATSWRRNINVNVTSHFRNAGMLNFLTRVSVTGTGEGYSRLRAIYDPDKLIMNEVWEVPERLQQALDTNAACNVSYRCLEDPIPAGNNCTDYNGYRICKSMFDPVPAGLEGLSPSCKRAEVFVDCSNSETSSYSTCDELQEAGCGFLSGDCVPEFYDEETGICWLDERRYDCSDMLAPTSSAAALVCGVRCMGTECVSHDPMISTDFARAAGLMQAAQFIGQDTNCGTAESGGICKVFEGEAYECKVALGGWSDCCESPGGISLKDYVDLLQAGNKVLSAKKWLGTINNPVAGGWNGAKEIAMEGLDQISGTVKSAYSSMTQSFTAAWEGIAGNATATAAEAASAGVTTGTTTVGGTAGTSIASEGLFSAVGTMVNTLTEQTARWVMETFGEMAVDAIFSATTTTAAGVTTTGSASAALSSSGGAAGGTAGTTGSTTTIGLGGTILGPIMMAYMIYAILNILVQIIWKCEEREFEYGAKRELKTCHYLGSYCASEFLGSCIEVRKASCCFTSPMSRILQEQIRPQLGMSWGSAKNPNCDGIPIEDLEGVDWNQVDLSEWIGILSITDNNPEIDPSLLEMNNLTGSGNALNDAIEDFEREDVFERTQTRFDEYNPQDVNEEMSQGLYGY